MAFKLPLSGCNNPLTRSAKIIATLGPATWTPDGMARLLAADVDVVRFNVKHQTPEENQLLLDMWRSVAQQDWQEQQAKLGLTGLVNPDASPVGIMVSFVWRMRSMRHTYHCTAACLVVVSDSSHWELQTQRDMCAAG